MYSINEAGISTPTDRQTFAFSIASLSDSLPNRLRRHRWIEVRMHTECTQRVGATLDKFTADSFDRWIDTIGHSLVSLRFAQRSSIRTILHALAFFYPSMRSRIIRAGERNTRIASTRSMRYSWIKNPARFAFAFLCIASTSYEEKRSSGLAGWISWMSCISLGGSRDARIFPSSISFTGCRSFADCAREAVT